MKTLHKIKLNGKDYYFPSNQPIEVNPLCVRKAGTYTIKAVRENNDDNTVIDVWYLDENGERDSRVSVYTMWKGEELEKTVAFTLESDGYGLEIESTATCTMYAPVDLAFEALKAEFGTLPLENGVGNASLVQMVADGETENTADGKGAITFGFGNVNNGQNVIVFGQGCEATEKAKSALCGGKGSKVNHFYTVALGRTCEANGYYSFASGKDNKSNGDSSMAFGGNNTVEGMSAGAIGSVNVVSGANSVALGSSNTIGSKYSVAMGAGNEVNPIFADGGETTTGFAFGSANKVLARGGNGALGGGNNVSGGGAYALGSQNTVSGHHSVALGAGHTIIGEQSGAIGNNNVIKALDAFSAGVSNTIEGEATGAMALGRYLKVNHLGQTVIGVANDNKPDTLFEVGNGYVGGNKVKTRTNAFEVYKDGTVMIQKFLSWWDPEYKSLPSNVVATVGLINELWVAISDLTNQLTALQTQLNALENK